MIAYKQINKTIIQLTREGGIFMIKLYVVTHKESSFLPNDRVFIGVGKNKNIKNVFVYDDRLDNISNKNDSFCELTALYWIWKNESSDVIGFEHYRRFFCYKSSFFFPRILTKKKINRVLSKHDCIVSKEYYFYPSIYDYYCAHHYKEDLDKCFHIVKEKYPSYVQSFQKFIYGAKACMCNMFIMKKEMLDDYCEWLFEILFELERTIDIQKRDTYQKRVFGFLSERLFNVWLENKHFKIAHYPIYMPKDIPVLLRIKSFIAMIIHKK